MAPHCPKAIKKERANHQGARGGRHVCSMFVLTSRSVRNPAKSSILGPHPGVLGGENVKMFESRPARPPGVLSLSEPAHARLWLMGSCGNAFSPAKNTGGRPRTGGGGPPEHFSNPGFRWAIRTARRPPVHPRAVFACAACRMRWVVGTNRSERLPSGAGSGWVAAIGRNQRKLA